MTQFWVAFLLLASVQSGKIGPSGLGLFASHCLEITWREIYQFAFHNKKSQGLGCGGGSIWLVIKPCVLGRTFISTPTCNTQFQMNFGTNFQPRPKKIWKKFRFPMSPVDWSSADFCSKCMNLLQKSAELQSTGDIGKRIFFQIFLVWAEHLYQNTFETEFCKWGWK